MLCKKVRLGKARAWLVAAAIGIAGVAKAAEPVAFAPFAPGEVKVGGEIGRRMQITADKLTDKIDIEKTFFIGFRNRRETPLMWGGFSGWGMALDAIVKASAHGIGGEKMRRFKRHWVDETISVQSTDGAISMFAKNPGVWDNHEQAYILQALCYDCRWGGEDDAQRAKEMAAARKLADYLIGYGTKNNIGLETAFIMLFQESGDWKYADYCRDRFATEKGNGQYDGGLLENGVVHVYTYLQRSLAQMQYEKATGRGKFGEGAASTDELFRRVFDDYSSVSGSLTGGAFWGEVWDRSQAGLGKWGETCASAYLMRAIAERMKDHPESRLGDVYERVMYNAFFGAQSHDGAKQRYFIPFDEPGEWFERETYCCPNNLRRMMFEIPDAVFFRTADGFAINLFAPAELTAKGLKVRMDTDYPNSGKVSVKIAAEKAGRMLVRVPRWASKAGGWREVKYGVGDSEEKWEMAMPVRLVEGRVAQAGKVAIMRGPVVYALDEFAGWYGEIDAQHIDGEKPIAWNGKGVELTLCSEKFHKTPRHATFVPFASDARMRTYFKISGKANIVADELYAPVGERELEKIYETVKTPHKVGVILEPDEGKMLDNPNVFRFGDTWWMLYIQFDQRGYETHLAKSADLIHWTKCGCVLSRGTANSWDCAQADGGPSLLDVRWEGSNMLGKFAGRHWMTYIGGAKEGYETDPLSIGVANALSPTNVWQRARTSPALSTADADLRRFEKRTLYKSFVLEDPDRTLGFRFVMFYNGKHELQPQYESIGMAVSDDMVNWKRYGSDSVIANGKVGEKFAISGDPMVRKIGDLWVMFYFGAGWNSQYGGAFDTFAVSRDLVRWTKWQGRPLVAPSESWDRRFAHKPWVIRHNGVTYHYYCAVGEKGRVLALATSRLQ